MLSRRDFLRIASVGAGAALLNACAPKILSPTPFPSATILPTSTSVPTITPTAVPTPDFSLLLRNEIFFYAAAWGYNEQEISARTTVATMVDSQGNQFKVVIDPQTSIPLLITDQQSEWQSAGLKELAKHGGINVGQLLGEQPFNIVQQDFNLGIVGSGWGWSTQPVSPGTYNYDYEEHELYVGGLAGIKNFYLSHLINAHKSELPGWLQHRLDRGNVSKQELTDLMTGHIKAMMGYFNGKIYEYNVVNEPYFEDDPFLPIIGPEYIDIAFQVAREADSSAKLIFNLFDNHWSGGANTMVTKELVGRLKSKDLIDKVGLQMHINDFGGDNQITTSPMDIVDTIRSYGLPAVVSEFDVDIRDIKGSTQDRFIKQAEIYERILKAAFSSGVVKDLCFWGVIDKTSFLEDPSFQYSSPLAQPLMWDDNSSPKPAYYAVRKVLLAAVGTRI